MRDIKFRAWDEVNNRMGTPALLHFSICGVENKYQLAGGNYSFQNRDKYINAKYLILMQFTGLKDKNGKEAYHKDICRANWPYAKISIIEWDESRAAFYFKPLDGLKKAACDKGYKLNANKFEIIGNIYENPELLKG